MAINIVELECKNCGAPLSARDVSDELAVARCPHCQGVFALEKIAPPPAETKRVSLPLRAFSRPRYFQVQREADKLEFEGTPALAALLTVPFALVFIVLPLGLLLSLNAAEAGIFMLIPLVFVGVGTAMFFKTLDTGLSKVRIFVDNKTLDCRKRGLRSKWYCCVPVDSILQLYVTEHTTHRSNNPTTWYHLHCIRSDGNRELIYDHFRKPEQALYIEQEIEEFLGLENLRVGDSGEISR